MSVSMSWHVEPCGCRARSYGSYREDVQCAYHAKYGGFGDETAPEPDNDDHEEDDWSTLISYSLKTGKIEVSDESGWTPPAAQDCDGHLAEDDTWQTKDPRR